MNPVRAEPYKGYEIRIYVWAMPDKNCVGMYEIYPHTKLAEREVTRGGFVISEKVEEVALESAKAWIDGQC